MRSNTFINNTIPANFPHPQSPTQEPLEPFLNEVLYSKVDFPYLSRGGSFSSLSTSDSVGSCDFSSEEKSHQALKTQRQVVMERRHRNFQVKKKTELCKTFQLGLVCKYGNKCSFAHGVEELRDRLLVPTNYKTVNCKQFHEQGYCHYGSRCQFIHNDLQNSKFEPLCFGYQKIFDGLEIGCDYAKCNGMEITDINMRMFLDERVNTERFGVRRLCVFQKFRA